MGWFTKGDDSGDKDDKATTNLRHQHGMTDGTVTQSKDGKGGVKDSAPIEEKTSNWWDLF